MPVGARANQLFDLAHGPGRAHQDDLVAGWQLSGTARHEQPASPLDRDDQRALREMQPADRGGDPRRRSLELVFKQPHDAAGKHFGVDRAWRRHHLLDINS